MSDRLSELRSAVIDGRCLNPIFRKTQLQQLHQALTQNASKIRQSLLQDAVLDQTQIGIQILLSMKLLAESYEALDPEKEMREEYAVAEGRGLEHGRQAVGAVVLKADATSPAFVFSLMSVLVPAITAGNCVVIQIEESLLESSRTLLDIISEALDKDIFLATKGENEVTPSMLAPCRAVLVSQIHQEQAPNPSFYCQIDSNSQALVIAIVERDADLKLAAQSLVHARFELGGRSQYAQDIVLVNEGVKRDFLTEVVKETAALFGQLGSLKPCENSRRLLKETVGDFGKTVEAKKGLNVLFSGSDAIVVDIEDRKTAVLGQKIRESFLAIHSVTSMDDAIDWTSRHNDIGAAYVFASPNAAKYITQFIDSPTCFVNDIPIDLLFNPIASRLNPITRQGSVLTTYSQHLFTTPKIIFFQSSKTSNLPELSRALINRASGDFPLPSLSSFKRATMRPDIGFFEQGIITGALMLLSSVALGGLGCYYGVRTMRPFLVSWT